MNTTLASNIKTMVSGGSYELSLVKLMAQSLQEEELRGLIADFNEAGCRDEALFIVLQDELNRVSFASKCRRELEARTFNRNEPVSQLLKWYNNRKSGKVIYARTRLHERFIHLSCSEQISAIRSFLSGGKTDREWCYNTLRRWWAEELEQDVIKAWNQFHEERCGWLFPKYMPVDIIREHLENLSYDSNYYQLCRRLAAEDWFEIDKVRLRKLTEDHKYMWIMSQTPKGLLPDEAMEIVFRRIAVAAHNFDLDENPDIPFSHERHSVDKYFSLSVESPCDSFYMSRLKNMDKMLSSMCRMGLHGEVQQFLIFDRNIHDDFISLHQTELDGFENYDDTAKSIILGMLCRMFVKYYAMHFPTKYERQLYYWKADKQKPGTPQTTVQGSMSEDSIIHLSDINPAMKELINKFGLEPVSDDIPF